MLHLINFFIAEGIRRIELWDFNPEDRLVTLNGGPFEPPYQRWYAQIGPDGELVDITPNSGEMDIVQRIPRRLRETTGENVSVSVFDIVTRLPEQVGAVIEIIDGRARVCMVPVLWDPYEYEVDRIHSILSGESS